MKIAEGLGLRAISYDASKALFEDVLGYPTARIAVATREDVG